MDIDRILENLYEKNRLSDDEIDFLIAEIARLRAEVEALRVDAERYRYLKDVSAFRAMSLDMSGKHTWTLVGRPIRGEGSTIDAAIDAARGKDNG